MGVISQIDQGIRVGKALYSGYKAVKPYLRQSKPAQMRELAAKLEDSKIRSIAKDVLKKDKENSDYTKSLTAQNFISGKVLLAPNDYIPELVQGTQEGQRLGNKIDAKSLRMYLHLTNGTTKGIYYDTHFRITMARWRFPDGANTLPTTSDVATYGTPLDMNKWDVRKSYHVKITAVKRTVDDSPVQKSKFMVINFPMNRVLQYSDATTSCPNNYPVYIILTSNNTDAIEMCVMAAPTNTTLYFENK